MNPFADYLEATCTDIDPANKVITCQSVICEGTVCDIEEFSLNYDHLLIAVGAATNTYGIPVRQAGRHGPPILLLHHHDWCRGEREGRGGGVVCDDESCVCMSWWWCYGRVSRSTATS